MGAFPSPQWSGEESRMIKSVFLAVVAAASAAPEADPQLLLGAHAALPYAAAPVVAAPAAYGFAPVGAVHSSSVVKSVVEAPAEVSHEVTAHAVPVAVGYHGYGLHGYYGKREADAAVLAGHTMVLTPPTPLIHNAPVLPVVHHAPAVAAVGYAGLGYAGLGYHGLGYGLPHAIVKRDADPAVIAGRTTVLSAPTPLIHNPPVLPVVHHPVVAAPAVAAVGYAGLGYHGLGYGLPYAAHAVVKRDAEADPAVVLAGAYAHGLPYAAAPVVAPAVHAFASVGAVAHAPVVKAVVEAPAEVSHEVTAHAVPVAVGYHGYGGYPYYG